MSDHILCLSSSIGANTGGLTKYTESYITSGLNIFHVSDMSAVELLQNTDYFLQEIILLQCFP